MIWRAILLWPAGAPLVLGELPRRSFVVGGAFWGSTTSRLTLVYRTNGLLVQTFTVDTINQLSNVTRTGAMTVTGATPAPATSITVNGLAGRTYGDFTFAVTNVTLNDPVSSFIIVGMNGAGVISSNHPFMTLPASVNFAYDGNGNLTNDGTRSFYYDAENELTNVAVLGSWQSVFVYDGLSRRRIERDYMWQSGAWVLTNETRYLYDGMQVVQERDTNNNPLVTYTRGLDLSQTLSGAGGIGGLLARTDANGSTFYHSDGVGNVTALMDGAGNVAARYEYDGYGKLIGKWGALASANKMRFSSMPFNDTAGLALYPFRAYEPNFQRWLNRDPIGEWGGLNLYTYVGNSPLNYVDPYGLATAVIIGGPSPAGPDNSSGNPFGHASIATTGQGIYSFGTGTPAGSSLTDFLNQQATYRDSTVYILNTTPEQEKAINDYLKSKKGKPINKYPDNCARRTTDALKAGDAAPYDLTRMPHSDSFDLGENVNGNWPSLIGEALQNDPGVLQISVPKGTTLPPNFLTGFNPKK